MKERKNWFRIEQTQLYYKQKIHFVIKFLDKIQLLNMCMRKGNRMAEYTNLRCSLSWKCISKEKGKKNLLARFKVRACLWVAFSCVCLIVIHTKMKCEQMIRTFWFYCLVWYYTIKRSFYLFYVGTTLIVF